MFLSHIVQTKLSYVKENLLVLKLFLSHIVQTKLEAKIRKKGYDPVSIPHSSDKTKSLWDKYIRGTYVSIPHSSDKTNSLIISSDKNSSFLSHIVQTKPVNF